MDNMDAIRAFSEGEDAFDVPRSNNLHTPLPYQPDPDCPNCHGKPIEELEPPVPCYYGCYLDE